MRTGGSARTGAGPPVLSRPADRSGPASAARRPAPGERARRTSRHGHQRVGAARGLGQCRGADIPSKDVDVSVDAVGDLRCARVEPGSGVHLGHARQQHVGDDHAGEQAALALRTGATSPSARPRAVASAGFSCNGLREATLIDWLADPRLHQYSVARLRQVRTRDCVIGAVDEPSHRAPARDAEQSRSRSNVPLLAVARWPGYTSGC
jgi:hypothetical protein